MKNILSIFIFILWLPVCEAQTQEAYVKRVISGNRIELNTGNTVEYIGVNIPMNSDNCISNPAFEFNKKLVEAKTIRLEFDEKVNNDYGCLLAYVYCNDLFINAEIIKQGYGIVNIHSPNIRYAELLIKVEREAREQKRGFWSENRENHASEEYTDIERRIQKLEARFDELNKKIDQLIELVNVLILKLNGLSVEPEIVHKINENQDIKIPPSSVDNLAVYVTKSGKKYHKLGCRFLGENPSIISLEEAKQKGYQPCKICFPE